MKIRNNICKFLHWDCIFDIFVMKITSAKFSKRPLGILHLNCHLLDKMPLGKGLRNFHKLNLGCQGSN